MNKRIHSLFLCSPILLLSSYTYAELSLYKDDNTDISIHANIALASFHSERGYIPNAQNKKYDWQEGYIQYGLGLNQKTDHFGSFYAKVNLVSAATWGDGDAGGYTDGSESATKLEDAYVGWKSGNLFPFLGEDGIDISYGRQSLCLGDGFLICADAPNLGNSPAFPKQYHKDGGGTYYLAGHRDFKDTAIVKIGQNQPIYGSFFTFKSNNPIQMYARFTGANIGYKNKNQNLEFTYLHNNSIDSDLADASIIGQPAFRNKMDVYSLRGTSDLNIPNANFAFEYAYQDKNNGDQANAWYLKAGYDFKDITWQPAITARYSRFSQKWDNLFIGASQYGTWFQGEVAYNYAGPFNNNTDITTLGLNITPKENLTLGVLAYRFNTLHTNNAVNFSGKELDLFAVWNIKKNIMLSPVLAFYKPKYSDQNGGLQNGNNHLNVYSALVLTANF
ncbi:MAG: hypothetical protein QM666_06890 [Acinetobacter sp.]